jgi:hypothetical protein
MRKALFSLSFVALVAACASSSGVKGDLVFNTLSASDWSKFCTWHNAELSALTGKSCGAGTLLPNSEISCMNKSPVPNCTATVAQVEDCVRRFKDRACEGIPAVVATCNGFPPACTGILVGSNQN